MTLQQANEIIAYFKSNTLPKLEEGIFENIAPVPSDSQKQADYMHLHWRENYDDNCFNEIAHLDLTVGIYYYEKNKHAIHRAPLTKKWLAYQGIVNFPDKFTEILDQTLSSESE